MKKSHQNSVLILFFATLTACSGSSTQYVDYAPVDNTPKLDMKAAIYQAVLPSGNTLVITTDQSGTIVNGTYSIKYGSAIISSGTVSNIVSRITLKGYPGSPCSDEAITIVPSNINNTNSEADINLSGQKSCSESLTTTNLTRLRKFVPTATSRLYAIGASGSSQELEIDVVSGDNINFVGSLTLYNTIPSRSVSATATIVGTATDSGSGSVKAPDIVPVKEIINATGLYFNGVRNTSGQFFDAILGITKIDGQIRTTTSGSQSSISEIIVTGFKDSAPSQQFGPIVSFTARQSYTTQP